MQLKNYIRKHLGVKATVLSLLAAIAVAVLLAGNHRPGSQAAVSPFLGRVENLAPGQYWWMGGQHPPGVQNLGYDLGMIRFNAETEKWTDLRDNIPSDEPERSKNNHLLIYGQPAYAVADGEVVRCWRNAPENPKPGQTRPNVVDPGNIPKSLADKPKILGGGNHLWVRHNNGDLALYAHMKTGSIPANLCPIPSEEFIEVSEMDLPEGNRPKVTKGQMLAQVGASDSSGGPHMHIHLQTGNPDSGNASNSVPLPFHGAYIKNTTLTEDVLADWKRMQGEQMTAPPQPVIWPDYSGGQPELARHAVPSSDFQFTFDHITKSGYRMVWVDGYEVNGKNYFNMIFRPKDGTPWVVRVGMTDQQYADEFTLRVGQGYRPLQVESYMAGQAIRYAVIFVKQVGQAGPDWVTYHDKTDAQQAQLFNTLLGQGFIPRNISVVSVSGQRSYTTFYEKVPVTGLVTLWAMTAGQYQTQYDLNAGAGRKLVYLKAYQQSGSPRFAAIWLSPVAGVSAAKHGLSEAQYQDQSKHWTDLGYLTRCVTGYELNDAAGFAAVWRK